MNVLTSANVMELLLYDQAIEQSIWRGCYIPLKMNFEKRSSSKLLCVSTTACEHLQISLLSCLSFFLIRPVKLSILFSV